MIRRQQSVTYQRNHRSGPGSTRRSARGGRQPEETGSRRIYVGAAAGALLLIGLALYLGGGDPRPVRDIVWIAEKSTAAPGGVPDALRTRVLEVAEAHDGTLTAYAVGDQARRVGAVDLAVRRDGEREDRPEWRSTAVGDRLDALADAVADAPVSDAGFSFHAALQLAAEEGARTNHPVEVWLSSTVLSGSIDPMVMSTLTNADSTFAAAEVLKGSLGALDLSQVDLHVILLAPVGDAQPPLSPASELWRTNFVVALAQELGATVEPVTDRSNAAPWPQSSRVPPIRPLPDPTPLPPTRPDEPVVIDNVAFIPDTAILIDPDAARRAMALVVEQLRSETGRKVDITGYTAAFGNPETARKLSADRANTFADLLVQAGLSRDVISVRGVGFDERADPDSDPQSAAQRVVVIELRD